VKFPEIALAVGDTLGEALLYVLERFEQEGLEPQLLDEVIQQLPIENQAALFSINASASFYIFVVVTQPWDEELLTDMLNSLLSVRQSAPETKLVFKLLSAHPLPPVLSYLFEESLRGALECEAVVEVRFALSTPQPAERPAYLARQCQRWLQLHCHHTLYPQDLDSLRWLNQLVLEQVRSPLELLPPENTYEPLNSLISIGCLVGEILVHQPQIMGRWLPQERLGGTLLQLAPSPNARRSWFSWREPPDLDLTPTWEEAILVSPIDWVVELFREGEGIDLKACALQTLSRWEVG